MKKLVVILFSLITIHYPLTTTVLAGPQSTNYEIKDYSFGAGGTGATGSNTTNYTIFGTAGELEYGKLTSTNYGVGSGLIWEIKAGVPPAPTFTNPATNYDRLKIVISIGGNPSDATYAVAISGDNFATDTRYVQSDFTIGSSFGASNFMTYATWGSASGKFITNLKNSTTYTVKVKARQGNFTESEYTQTAQATTSDSSLTFGVDSNNITFANLNGANSYTDSTKSTVLTTSTNAYGGYTIYTKETQALTSPDGTIADYGSANSAPTTWSGTGFGYTTNDNNLGGSGGTTRFSSGTKYAGFVTNTSAPGDPAADNLGPVQDPAISNEQFTISYRVTADNTTKAGTYQNVIIYTIVPNY
ncbi:hypothetical protein HY024_01060 [Candidatus Curtissbacteria bacterium]|nr:hypothetical protein [Candidatus Curtissbacteria bacterium]